MCIPAWPPSVGRPRQNLRAQCARIQRCQNESVTAKVKTNFPPVLKQKITRSFFKLKKNMAKIVFRGRHWRHTLRNQVGTSPGLHDATSIFFMIQTP